MSEALKLDSPKKAETKILNAQIFLHCRFFLFLSFRVPFVSVCFTLSRSLSHRLSAEIIFVVYFIVKWEISS